MGGRTDMRYGKIGERYKIEKVTEGQKNGRQEPRELIVNWLDNGDNGYKHLYQAVVLAV